MNYRFAAAVFGLAAVSQFSIAGAQQMTTPQPVSSVKNNPGPVSALPPLPKGDATVIGGVIRDVDPVRDQIRLNIPGGKSMDIFFDARTHVYRDGKRVAQSDLKPEEHASVETVLDGTNVYALNVHMLSHAPQGDVQGQVVDYDPSSGELTVTTALTRGPVKLVVPASARVFRDGQSRYTSAHSGAARLESGDLVSVTFTAGHDGRGVASEVAILATPGSAFVFSGSIAVLDLHSGLLVVRNESDNTTYRLHFNPLIFPMTKFHEGDSVRVTARFDGTQYEASSITPG